MRAYRHLSEKELIAIQNGNMENIGSIFTKQQSNGHHYSPNKKYLHFFRKLEDIEYIQQVHKDFNQKFYICEFNIPLRYWFLHYSHGIYHAKSGYEIDSVGENCVYQQNFLKQNG